jgi:hypothetical protein
MVAFFYKPEVKGKEESQRAADVNPLVINNQKNRCGP